MIAKRGIRHALFVALVVLGGGRSAAQPSPAPSTADRPIRPNVVLIITDDLGYGDLGFQGCKDIPTPNLDALAAGGVRFSQAYVTGPLCGPTRAGLITGRYQQRHSYDSNPGPGTGLNLNETTLADAFKAGGYATAAFGKWHLGATPDYRPWRRGFDEFFGFYGAAHSYVPGAVSPSAAMVFERTRRQRAGRAVDVPARPPAPPRGLDPFGRETGAAPGRAVRGTAAQPDVEVEEAEYLTEALAREATAFIDRHRVGPFFAYVAFNASHSPLQPTKKYLDRFPALTGKRQAYAATTSALDDAVGAIVARLRDLGLEDRTLIYFTNDNGGPIDDIAASNAPLSGAKFSLWEGGIRVPAFVRWKGTIPAGQTFDAPVSSLDAYPTLLAAAGLAAPKDKHPDGVNLLPALRGLERAPLPSRTLYWRYNEFWAIRSGDWKLVLPEPGEPLQLFDLGTDVVEEHDLAAKHPDVVQRLTADWRAWDEKNLPVKKSPPRPAPKPPSE